MRNQRSEYVQYGCGLCAPDSWRNFDVSPTLRIQNIPLLGPLLTRAERFPTFPENAEYGDIVEGLPVRSASCEAIYCSHVLEHLALTELQTALQNTYLYLRPGGTFRFVLPDLERLAREYLESDAETAAHQFMQDTHLGVGQRPRGLEGLLRYLFGNSSHLWMWDYPSLAHELENAGFTSIRRATYGDASDPRFDDVEEKERWTGALGMECKKPHS